MSVNQSGGDRPAPGIWRRALIFQRALRRVAGLENGVELAALLEDLPGAGKARWYDEAVAARKFQSLPRLAREHHATRKQMAELMFRVSHGPSPPGCRPNTGKELLRRIRIVIPNGALGRA